MNTAANVDEDPLDRVIATLSAAFHYGLAFGVRPDELEALCQTVLTDVKRDHHFDAPDAFEQLGAVH